ncbi:MAG: biotin carboxylase [Anaerolineaceae bacterium]|nr:biotin carboxylase [Anaerolineaceae bacterium]
MSTQKIPKRISTAVIQSLSAGVVPRTGLEYIAVGRQDEIEALLYDIDEIVAEGGASFRMILGRYGSGKSFLCQLIRNYALQRDFVVMDADLSPVTRLTGTKEQGLNLYRELLKNAATKTRPDGGAFSALLERWISDLQQKVMQEDGISPNDPAFSGAVDARIYATVSRMEGMVHGFDFSTVISAYWHGHQSGDDTQKQAAMRWLRGEYGTKTEAREALGVRVIVDDSSWYDYIKLLAQFVKDIGYKGLVIFIDEAVNLYKISHTVSRNNNYERLLTIYNDIMQGKAQYFAVVVGATPQMVEDTRRGLFSYEALRTRLEESRFARNDLRDLSGPMIRLNVLTPLEIFVLLQRVRQIHGLHYGYDPTVTDNEIEFFLNVVRQRIGAEQLLTPREVVRDFLAILNIMQQNPTTSFSDIVGGKEFTPTQVGADPEALTPETEIVDEDDDSSPYTSFRL